MNFDGYEMKEIIIFLRLAIRNMKCSICLFDKSCDYLGCSRIEDIVMNILQNQTESY